MKNGNQPIHPCLMQRFGSSEWRAAEPGDPKEHSRMLPGMTKREYFAAMAPEVPGWFKCGDAPNNPREPKNWFDYSEGDPFREEMKNWISDPIFQVSEEISFFQREWEKYWSDRAEWENKNSLYRICQWRICYADALLDALDVTVKK